MRLLCAAAVALLIVGCGGTAPTPSPSPSPTPAAAAHSIVGTLTLYNDGKVLRNGVAQEYTESNLPGTDNSLPCNGTGDFSDVDSGAEIDVTDENGTVLGQGTLADDVTKTYDRFPKGLGGLAVSPMNTQCWYTFEIDGVADAPTYAFKVGNQKPVTWSGSDLAQQNWSVALTIGL